MTQQDNLVENIRNFLRRIAEGSLDDLEAAMRETGAAWSNCLEGVTEGQAAFQPAPAEFTATPYSGEGPRWSIKETVGHYLVSERSLNQTVSRMAGVASPGPSVPVVPEMGIQSAEYEALPLNELSEELAKFFEETVVLVRSLGDATNPDATFPHPVFGPLNPREWIAFHRGHAMDHIQQVEHIKAAEGYPGP